jgi:hypothetical protein
MFFVCGAGANTPQFPPLLVVVIIDNPTTALTPTFTTNMTCRRPPLHPMRVDIVMEGRGTCTPAAAGHSI